MTSILNFDCKYCIFFVALISLVWVVAAHIYSAEMLRSSYRIVYCIHEGGRGLDRAERARGKCQRLMSRLTWLLLQSITGKA